MRTECPECGSASTATIVYGMPAPETSEAAERGEVVLGGCVITVPVGGAAMADRACRDCGVSFVSRRPRHRRHLT